MNRIVHRILSLLLGLSFLISGWLKGVDPYGTSLKLSEYFRAWRWDGFVVDYPLVWSVCLCAGELCLGLLLLFGIFRRVVACGVVAVMSAFTALTAWLAFSPIGMSVQDCGCFGDAFTLEHEATLLKNVVLLLFSVGNLWTVWRGCLCGMKGWRTVACCVIFSLGIPLYSAIFLPPMDFLPFNRGTKLSEESDFGVYDARYVNVTDSLMAVSAEKPLVAVVSRCELTEYDLHKLYYLRKQAETGNIAFCLWTIPAMNDGVGIDVFYTDEVTLKSLLRARIGFVIVDKGVVRVKRSLSVFRPEGLGQSVLVVEMMSDEDGLLLRYILVLLTGLAVIAWVRWWETEGGR